MLQTHRLRAAHRTLWMQALGSVAVLSLSGALASASAAPISPEGLWYTKGKESIIKFQPCKPFFCGTVVWLKQPTEADGSPIVDSKNPDPQKRKTPLIGLDIFTDMTPVDDHWKGKAYNADDGKTYDITFTVKTDKEPNDEADVRGCILGFLCGTETFTRAAEVPGGDPTVAAAATVPAAPTKSARVHGAKKDLTKK